MLQFRAFQRALAGKIVDLAEIERLRDLRGSGRNRLDLMFTDEFAVDEQPQPLLLEHQHDGVVARVRDGPPETDLLRPEAWHVDGQFVGIRHGEQLPMPWIAFRLAGGIDLERVGAFLQDFHGEPQRQRRERVMWLDFQRVVQQVMIRPCGKNG